MGKSTISTGPFSIAILNYQRVTLFKTMYTKPFFRPSGPSFAHREMTPQQGAFVNGTDTRPQHLPWQPGVISEFLGSAVPDKNGYRTVVIGCSRDYNMIISQLMELITMTGSIWVNYNISLT